MTEVKVTKPDAGVPITDTNPQTVLALLEEQRRRVDKSKVQPAGKVFVAIQAALSAITTDDEAGCDATLVALGAHEYANWMETSDVDRVAELVRAHSLAPMMVTVVLQHVWLRAHVDRHWVALLTALVRNAKLWPGMPARPDLLRNLLALLFVPPLHPPGSCENTQWISLVAQRLVAMIAANSSEVLPMLETVTEPQRFYVKLVTYVTQMARIEKTNDARASFAAWLLGMSKSKRSMMDRLIDTLILESKGEDRRCVSCAKESAVVRATTMELARLCGATAQPRLVEFATWCATTTDTTKRILPEAKCANCGHVRVSQKCPRCKNVAYCGRDCRWAHWKATHKAECL
jgi:hypothetical protein